MLSLFVREKIATNVELKSVKNGDEFPKDDIPNKATLRKIGMNEAINPFRCLREPNRTSTPVLNLEVYLK